LKLAPARFTGKYEPITSTMSFAVAICSIVSDGIATEKLPSLSAPDQLKT